MFEHNICLSKAVRCYLGNNSCESSSWLHLLLNVCVCVFVFRCESVKIRRTFCCEFFLLRIRSCASENVLVYLFIDVECFVVVQENQNRHTYVAEKLSLPLMDIARCNALVGDSVISFSCRLRRSEVL